MYTFHKYWTAPTPDVIQEYLDYGSRYNVPVWIGESGENTDQWIEQFVRMLEKNKASLEHGREALRDLLQKNPLRELSSQSGLPQGIGPPRTLALTGWSSPRLTS